MPRTPILAPTSITVSPFFRFTPNPEEVMDTQWISIERVKKEIEICPEKFTPWLRIYIKEYSILKEDILNS